MCIATIKAGSPGAMMWWDGRFRKAFTTLISGSDLREDFSGDIASTIGPQDAMQDADQVSI